MFNILLNYLRKWLLKVNTHCYHYWVSNYKVINVVIHHYVNNYAWPIFNVITLSVNRHTIFYITKQVNGLHLQLWFKYFIIFTFQHLFCQFLIWHSSWFTLAFPRMVLAIRNKYFWLNENKSLNSLDDCICLEGVLSPISGLVKWN